MNVTVPEVVLAAVREVWPECRVTFSDLPGGMTNQNWKAESDERLCVVQLQLPEKAALKLGIDRLRQQRAHEYAAGVDAAPAILLRRADLGVLICAWQEGHPLNGPGDRSFAVIAALGSVLRRLHDGPCDSQMQSPTAEPFAGTWLLRERARDVAPEAAGTFDFAFAVLDEIERKRGCVTPTLTHGDLLPANILCAPDGVRLIDFEYAAVGDPLYDLGDLAGKNEFDRAEIRGLVRAYGSADEEQAAQIVSLFRFVSILREGLWAVAASENNADFDYLAYATSLVARLHGLRGDPDFLTELDAASFPVA